LLVTLAKPTEKRTDTKRAAGTVVGGTAAGVAHISETRRSFNFFFLKNGTDTMRSVVGVAGVGMAIAVHKSETLRSHDIEWAPHVLGVLR